MKRLHIYLTASILALTFLASCSNWLDVNPKSQIKSDVLLTTEDGFKSALIGAYIDMASKDLYGYNTSMYLPECLSRTWTIKVPGATVDANRDAMYYISTYDYTKPAVESALDKVWTKYYKTITELNNVISKIKEQNVSFQYNNDKLILGEALGLRAFCHLEVLRFFGPVPVDGVDAGQKAIPYITEVTRESEKMIRLSYSTVLTNIESDLNEAEEILSVDPIRKYTNAILNGSPSKDGPEDSWQYNRQNRFNYYAVLATKARLYNWMGDKEKSYDYSLKVITALNEKNTLQFELTTEGKMDNLVMRSEHIFAIHRPTLETESASIFGNESAYMSQTKTIVDKAFESTAQPNDIRRKLNRYWEEIVWGQNSTKINHFRKYTGNAVIKANNMVPLIRLSEMYFLAMENAHSLGQAATLFSDYRLARALVATTFDNVIDQQTLIARLEKEYIKEFIGEGQMFFFYKKHNYAKFTWPATYTLPAGVYNVPIPKSQLNFD